ARGHRRACPRASVGPGAGHGRTLHAAAAWRAQFRPRARAGRLGDEDAGAGRAREVAQQCPSGDGDMRTQEDVGCPFTKTVKRPPASFLPPLPMPPPAYAQVRRVEITSREPAGNYEVLRGKITGEVDPKDRHNVIIQDIALAPKNARGRVEYIATFALAKP